MTKYQAASTRATGMKILITGGAGFIGSAVIRHLIKNTNDVILNIDKLTYAGNLESLAPIADSDRYHFAQVDICDAQAMKQQFDAFQPDAVMHLAAESHVDRSIDGPAEFIQTNIVGTYVLLEAARQYWNTLEGEAKANFRFHHISTDEVYGDLPHPSELSTQDSKLSTASNSRLTTQDSSLSTQDSALSTHDSKLSTQDSALSTQDSKLSTQDSVLSTQDSALSTALNASLPLFTEETPYAPSSPYSASKASSDHLVRAWRRTYGLPILITNCSNNYGPYQFPEKLIPLVTLNALEGKPLPIYGKGDQIRDWLHVEDHARALEKVLKEGKVGETYNIGGHNEKTNLEVVKTLCATLDELRPVGETLNVKRKEHDEVPLTSYASLITYVTDRPGHDRRYAIDASKIQRELGWKPQETFETGIRKTIQWYLDNLDWCRRVQDGSYRGERLGLSEK